MTTAVLRSLALLIGLLLAECDAAPAHGGRVERWQPCRVQSVQFQAKEAASADAASAGSYSF